VTVLPLNVFDQMFGGANDVFRYTANTLLTIRGLPIVWAALAPMARRKFVAPPIVIWGALKDSNVFADVSVGHRRVVLRAALFRMQRSLRTSL
jgi:hypothetical protein